jgi:hypothetical protein
LYTVMLRECGASSKRKHCGANSTCREYWITRFRG